MLPPTTTPDSDPGVGPNAAAPGVGSGFPDAERSLGGPVARHNGATRTIGPDPAMSRATVPRKGSRT